MEKDKEAVWDPEPHPYLASSGFLNQEYTHNHKD